MGTTCLSVCPECSRHVRCGERACPFCGAAVTSLMRVLEYRVMTRLDRTRAFSLGAALTAAGFATSCGEGGPVYGAPCNPPGCMFPSGGDGNAGSPTLGGSSGSGGTTAMAGTSSAGEGGTPSDGGSSSFGGEGGVTSVAEGGAAGEGGAGAEGGADAPGGSASEAGSGGAGGAT
jgi:hypothetical protein